jgi:hypothetical protein
MAKKRKFEDAFRARVNHDPTLRAKYGDAWDKIASALKQERTLAVKSRFYGFGGSQLLSIAGIWSACRAERIARLGPLPHTAATVSRRPGVWCRATCRSTRSREADSCGAAHGRT